MVVWVGSRAEVLSWVPYCTPGSPLIIPKQAIVESKLLVSPSIPPIIIPKFPI